jgi:hypothetical protein
MTDAASASILMVAYSLSLKPAQALLGEPVTVVLRCQASGDAPETITFEHASLTLTLARGSAEPGVAFPNRRTVVHGDVVKRVAASGGVEHLHAGEERTRSFELLRVFPARLLDLGEFDVGYTLYDGRRDLGPKPAKLRIVSRPPSVPLLLGLLEDEDPVTRARAVGLLHRMTARGFDYDAGASPELRSQALARWQVWWQTVGSHLPWDYTAVGARAGLLNEPPEGFQRGSRLGGVVYEQQSLPGPARSALLESLGQWTKAPALAALAPLRSISPKDAALFKPDAEVERALAAALDKLAQAPDQAADAALLLDLAGRMPSPGLAAPLARWAAAIPRSDEWNAVRTVTGGLLDWLDPDRVPVWDVSARKKR